MAREATSSLRRPWVTAAGVACMTVGAPLLVLPGPGLLFIVAGLALLGAEYRWARRANRRLRDALRQRGL